MDRYEEKLLTVNGKTDPYFEAFRFKSFVKNSTEDEDISKDIAVVCSELMSNIMKHAETGTIKCAIQTEGREMKIELIAEDHGNGIPNVDSVLHDPDGTSSGLPTVKRIMDEMEITSLEGKGTTIIVKKTLL